MLRSLLLALGAGAAGVASYPGMENLLAELQTRQEGGAGGRSTSLLGDLTYLSDAELTPDGLAAKLILNGTAPGQSSDAYASPPPALGTPRCAADACCAWYHISAAMAARFRGPSGRCNDLARQAVRLGFHDAAGWSAAAGPRGGGGADGSIVLAPEEMARPANRGLEDAVAAVRGWHAAYGAAYGVGVADLVQMGATTAALACPLGPRGRFFAGRRDSAAAAPDGLLPSPLEGADVLVSRFRNMTVGPGGLAALAGAHTTSQQRFVDPSRAGDPQDGTPGVWDVLFYAQTLGAAPRRVFRFPSDVGLARDPRTAPAFQAFAGSGGQALWNEVRWGRSFLRGVAAMMMMMMLTSIQRPTRWSTSG